MPRSTPLTPPPIDEIFEKAVSGPEGPTRYREIARVSGVSPKGKYRHWDNLRQLKPPNGLTSEAWWLGVKMARAPLLRGLPLVDPDGQPFVYAMPDQVLEGLHFIDQHAAGEIAMPETILESEAAKKHYLVNSLIEEAIRSSQLEGATTTRVVAKEMIRSGRPPRDRSERMILNNYRAMEFMHDEMGETLVPDMVLQLHRVLTEETLDNPDAVGRLQLPGDERVVVWDSGRGELIHSPPPADQLEERLDLLCRFANGEAGGMGFMHPVVRAILVHFWLAYDHPFEDGNGRTARALFYWSMRTQGYWLTEYLSISRIFRMAPANYIRAFLYTESDARDTTYFVVYHLEVIERALREFQDYLKRKVRELRAFEEWIRQDEFNYRQVALLRNAVREPLMRYTFRSHARSHGVTFQTARTDLLTLRDRGLLTMRRVGRQYQFSPAPDLADRLRKADPG